jgi:pimeloyl-ACP methyl ester carboxylesterase
MVERAPVGSSGDGVGAPAPARGRLRRLTVSGVDLELYEGGEGPPLLLLHGFLELPTWSEHHELLAQRYHVLAPSLPGYAGSARPAWLESIEDLAYLGLDLVDALRLDDVRLVGHSLGGWIAAEMAVRCCHRLRKLVLVDAVGVRCGGPVARAGGFITDWLALAPEQVRPLAWHDPATGHRLKLPGEAGTTQEELTTIIAGRETATVYGWKPFFFNPRLPRWLHRIQVPTLVIWGEHDGIVPREAGEAYASGIPDARFVTVAGSAHLPHLEQPDVFARLVADFLA